LDLLVLSVYRFSKKNDKRVFINSNRSIEKQKSVLAFIWIELLH